MKSYREIADNVFARRDAYIIEQRRKKQVIARTTVSVGSVALVSLAGFALFKNDAFHDAPLISVSDTTTTVTNTPTKIGDTTTAGDATAPTTDGGIVTPTNPTTTDAAPSQSTTVTTTGKTQPPVTTPSKTEPTKTTTVPKKALITADEPEDFSALSEAPLAEVHPISPALREKMDLYNGEEVVYSVIVEVVWTDEESEQINRIPEENDELIQIEEKRDIAYDAFCAALEETGGLYTPEVQEKRDLFRKLANECMNLRDLLTDEYAALLRNRRVTELSNFSDQKMIPLLTDARFYPFFAHDSNYAFFMELTADEIHDLAKQGGFIIRLVFPDGDREIHFPD